MIDSQCYEHKDVNPLDDTQICAPIISTDSWTTYIGLYFCNVWVILFYNHFSIDYRYMYYLQLAFKVAMSILFSPSMIAMNMTIQAKLSKVLLSYLLGLELGLTVKLVEVSPFLGLMTAL